MNGGRNRRRRQQNCRLIGELANGGATLGTGFGEGDISSIAGFGESANGGATLVASFGDTITSFVAFSAIREWQGDFLNRIFRERFCDLVYYKKCYSELKYLL